MNSTTSEEEHTRRQGALLRREIWTLEASELWSRSSTKGREFEEV